MTQYTQYSAPHWPQLWNLDRNNRVLNGHEKEKLWASLSFILENFGWIHADQSGALGLCRRIYQTVPPYGMQKLMDIAKEMLVQTISTQNLLLAILPPHLPVIEVENPLTKSTQRFIKINLDNWNDADLESVKTAFKICPELGISVASEQNLERLEKIARTVPQLKAFHYTGSDLIPLPFVWEENMEWLYCTEVIDLVLDYPRLIGVIAFKARAIRLDQCPTLKKIHAPKAIEIDCPDSEGVEQLRASSARYVSFKSFNCLIDTDIENDVKFELPVPPPILTEPLEVNPVEEFLEANLPREMGFSKLYNEIERKDEYYLVLPFINHVLSDDNSTALQIIFSLFPDVGLILGKANAELHAQLVSLVPAVRTLYFLESIPDSFPLEWRKSVKSLRCDGQVVQIRGDYPNLKNILAPLATIITCEHPEMKTIYAKNLIQLYVKNPRELPKVISQASFDIVQM